MRKEVERREYKEHNEGEKCHDLVSKNYSVRQETLLAVYSMRILRLMYPV